MNKLAPIRGLRAGEAIAAQIRELFYAGLKPGDSIGTETELAKRFGVSRITLRDAIRSLEAEGIVVVAVGAGGGIRIAESRPDRLGDALATQLHLGDVSWAELAGAMHAIEPEVVRLAAERVTTADIERLRHLVEESTRLVERPSEFTSSALDFHLTLAEISGNRVLLAAVRMLRTAQQVKFSAETRPETAQRVAARHLEIVQALERGDGDAAASAMRDHLDLVAAALD